MLYIFCKAKWLLVTKEKAYLYICSLLSMLQMKWGNTWVSYVLYTKTNTDLAAYAHA